MEGGGGVHCSAALPLAGVGIVWSPSVEWDSLFRWIVIRLCVE